MISIVLPVYNEERYVARCLRSLLAQVECGDFEIIVVDGRSTDATATIVREFEEFGSKIRLLDNPNRFQVYAWNIGWRAARGDYVACAIAHADYDPHYLLACRETLERTGATAVGPVTLTRGAGVFGTAVAWCMSSPFGIGNARYRYTRVEEEVDSVFNIFTRRSTFEELGGYDERVPYDEDGEFNHRLRRAGGRIVVSPAPRVRYYVRDTLQGLARQMYGYGFWRRFSRVLHPEAIPWRVYVPPALTVGLALSLMLALTPLRGLAPVVPLLYAAFLGAAAFSASRVLRARSVLCVPVALTCMHVSYGFGFLRALFIAPERRLSGRIARTAAH